MEVVVVVVAQVEEAERYSSIVRDTEVVPLTSGVAKNISLSGSLWNQDADSLCTTVS